MTQEITVVDAFTDRPFRGNPAAVCVLTQERDDSWMQDVAREMNLSETAFLLDMADGYNLRWFTPAMEVKLCGHATLASAHVLWESGRLATDREARFHTRSGLLTARWEAPWIELNFPAHHTNSRTDLDAAVREALAVVPKSMEYAPQLDYLLVEVATEAELREVRPNLSRVADLLPLGLIVTSRSSNANYDFMSRFFAPRAGVNEDPVCGSSHCVLGPFWGARLGKDSLRAYQASARGGTLRIRLQGDRLDIGGQAVSVLRASFLQGSPVTQR